MSVKPTDAEREKAERDLAWKIPAAYQEWEDDRARAVDLLAQQYARVREYERVFRNVQYDAKHYSPAFGFKQVLREADALLTETDDA